MANTKKDKTMNRNERLKIAEAVNLLFSVTQYISECHDLHLSDIAKLEDQAYALKRLARLAPPKGENGFPEHYKPLILDSDPNAWVYSPEG